MTVTECPNNEKVNPVTASNQPQPNSVAPQLGLNALLGDSAICDWGFGGKETMPLEVDPTDWSKQPIDVRWQQIDPEEGHWTKAENWREYQVMP